jgi:virulence factor
MLKIGLVDLDTSHPGRWVPILQEWETVEVVACWDGGEVRPSGYAQTFAQEHNIGTVADSLEQMVDLVDVAFIQTNNWDLHLDRAGPFLAAGKGVYIDKPIAGNLAHLTKLKEWAVKGGNIVAGSSLRCCQEVKDIARAIGQGQPITVYATGPNDFFNYGIHSIEMAQSIAGKGAESVTHLGSFHAERYLVRYPGGLQVLLELCAPGGGFHVAATATTGHWAATVTSDFYRALLEDIVAHFLGERSFLADIHTLCEAVEILLAGRASKRIGQTVFLDELPLSDPGFDGTSFNESYRLARLAAA